MPARFTVPQFITNETAIIGKVTIRQFLICLTGALFIFISYKMFRFTTFIFVGLSIIIVTGVIAFVKINGRPFHFFVLNFLETMKKPNLRIWNHKNESKDKQEVQDVSMVKDEYVPQYKSALDVSSLNKLALVVDTNGVYQDK